MLERVNGELAEPADRRTGGERVLQDLEAASAFVVSLDAARSWFRYHHLFADLLQLELRRTEPGEVTELHALAAGWLAEHGFAVEAVRHAAGGAGLGAGGPAAGRATGRPCIWTGRPRPCTRCWPGSPPGLPTADAELAAVAAADELAQGSLEAAERYLALASAAVGVGAGGRRGQGRLLLGVVRLLLARQRGNLPAVAAEARGLQAMAEVRTRRSLAWARSCARWR